MIKIVIADDHQILIDGLVKLIKEENNFSTVGTCSNGLELLKLLENTDADIVITDLKMPEKDGISVISEIKYNYPQLKVIAFTMFENETFIQNVKKAGGDGYVLKNSPFNEIKKAIYHVLSQSNFYLDSTLKKNILEHSVLTKTEQEILNLIAKGNTNAEMAEIRFCSISTIEKHRKNMIFKLGLKGTGELLRYALKNSISH